MGLRRREMLAGLAASAAFPAAASPPQTSRRAVLRPSDLWRRSIPAADDLIDRARLGGSVSFAVMDVRSGHMVETRDPLVRQPPASTAKALTALYALDALGPDHRFTTALRAGGPVTDGVLSGPLILAGGGDPTLNTDGLAELVLRLKAAGIVRIEGGLQIWGAALPVLPEIDEEQPDHVGYNAAVGGLNLNFNRVHFEWTRTGTGYGVTMQARSARHRPPVSLSRMRIVERAGPVYTYNDVDGHDQWTVARKALGTGGARWLPVRRPGLYAGEVCLALLKAQGIDCEGPVGRADAPGGDVLVSRDSPPLRDILQDMLRYSTNVTAEVAGLAATVARGGPFPDDLPASALRMSGWLAEGMGAGSALLEDHSGLGDDSRISASDMARIMARAHAGGALGPLLKPFRLEEDTAGLSVIAKTGTLNFVSALAGYCDGVAGSRLAFAIFCSDMDRRDALTVDQRERPQGGRAWAGRARTLQRRLLARWGALYAGQA